MTDKQINFCREYVKDYNGTQAAIRAGYSEKTAAVKANQLLHKENILNAIKQNQKELVESSCLTEEKVIAKVEEILERCMSAEPVMEWNYEEHRYEATGEYQFDSKGALKAIEMLGKHLGMFDKKEKKSVEGNDNTKEFATLIKSINSQAAEVWDNEDKA